LWIDATGEGVPSAYWERFGEKVTENLGTLVANYVLAIHRFRVDHIIIDSGRIVAKAYLS